MERGGFRAAPLLFSCSTGESRSAGPQVMTARTCHSERSPPRQIRGRAVARWAPEESTRPHGQARRLPHGRPALDPAPRSVRPPRFGVAAGVEHNGRPYPGTGFYSGSARCAARALVAEAMGRSAGLAAATAGFLGGPDRRLRHRDDCASGPTRNDSFARTGGSAKHPGAPTSPGTGPERGRSRESSTGSFVDDRAGGGAAAEDARLRPPHPVTTGGMPAGLRSAAACACRPGRGGRRGTP